MIGEMITKIRKEKGITKTELANLTGINIGHLTHIEKSERNPSHKALKNICRALDVPYQQLMYTYDKQINEEQINYGYIDHIAYNKVLAVDNLQSFIDCPSSIPSASLAIKISDSSMEPILKENTYAFIEFNSLLNNKDIGLFSIDGNIIIRKYVLLKKGNIILRANDKTIPDIDVTNSANFYIIGKVLNNQ